MYASRESQAEEPKQRGKRRSLGRAEITKVGRMKVAVAEGKRPPGSSERRRRVRTAEGKTTRAEQAAARAESTPRANAAGDATVVALETRLFRAVQEIVAHLGKSGRGRALAAASNAEALALALAQPELLEFQRNADPLLPARMRGLEARRRLLEGDGGTLGVDEVATHLCISRQAVDKRRRAGRLLALGTGRRGYRYPAFQFTQRGLLDGLDEVLSDLAEGIDVHAPDAHEDAAWSALRFFVAPNVRLDGDRPLDRLREGKLEAVRRAARTFGVQGAA